MQAFEVSGTIDPTGRLILDQPLQVSHPGRIRLIVLLEETDNDSVSKQSTSSSVQLTNASELYQFSFDPDAQPIWELVAEVSAQVPDEEWAKLPPDLARNFDKYQKQQNDE